MFFTYRTFEGNMCVRERLKETSNVRLKDPLCVRAQTNIKKIRYVRNKKNKIIVRNVPIRFVKPCKLHW